MTQTTPRTYIATGTLVLIVLLIGVFIATMVFSGQNDNNAIGEIDSFEECVEAGNPVMESYPEQCRTEDGRTFTRDIGNVLEKNDMVQVTAPRPGDEVGQTFSVEGQARGPWFFEASFAVFVENEEGEQIGRGIATAQSEWTTEDFVPFVAEVDLDERYTGTATLILEKQNASGLPENADSVHFPIEITTDGSQNENGNQNGDQGPVGNSGCYVGGCSGQVCSEDPDVVTTCEWRPEYACYDDATCERQADGECGWIETSELLSCLESAGDGPAGSV